MLTPLGPDDPRRIGPFAIHNRIGAGGMGTVYLGFNADGRAAAVKVPDARFADDPEFRERFRREVAAARRVHGRAVAAVLDADPEAASPWLATEYVEGTSLADAVLKHGRLEERLLHGFGVGLADALIAIHAVGVVHRDLKPSNILLAWDGPKVIDFGIARASGIPSHTRTGILIGTLAWMAPEQLRGERAGPAADVFAWGACMTYAATGHPPFASEQPDVLTRMREDRPPDIDGVPADLEPLVRAALMRRPELRPSAAELVRRLVSDSRVRTPKDADRAAALALTPWQARPPLGPAATGAAAAPLDPDRPDQPTHPLVSRPTPPPGDDRSLGTLPVPRWTDPPGIGAGAGPAGTVSTTAQRLAAGRGAGTGQPTEAGKAGPAATARAAGKAGPTAKAAQLPGPAGSAAAFGAGFAAARPAYLPGAPTAGGPPPGAHRVGAGPREPAAPEPSLLAHDPLDDGLLAGASLDDGLVGDPRVGDPRDDDPRDDGLTEGAEADGGSRVLPRQRATAGIAASSGRPGSRERGPGGGPFAAFLARIPAPWRRHVPIASGTLLVLLLVGLVAALVAAGGSDAPTDPSPPPPSGRASPEGPTDPDRSTPMLTPGGGEGPSRPSRGTPSGGQDEPARPTTTPDAPTPPASEPTAGPTATPTVRPSQTAGASPTAEPTQSPSPGTSASPTACPTTAPPAGLASPPPAC